MTTTYLTPRQVADQLGVHVRTVQRWIELRWLPVTRVGGRSRIAPGDLALIVKQPIRPVADSQTATGQPVLSTNRAAVATVDSRRYSR